MDQNHPRCASNDRPHTFGLVDLAWLAVQYRRLILSCAAILGIFSVVLSLLLKPDYTATVLLLPPALVSSAGAVLLPPDDALGTPGTLVAEQMPVPPDFYAGLMQTQGVEDALVRQFHLDRVYGERTESQARMRLEDRTTLDTDNPPLIQISVSDHDATRAAALANGYVRELNLVLLRIAKNDSRSRQEVFARELAEERTVLGNAEAGLAEFQRATGLIEPREQANAEIASVTQLRAQLTSRQVELHALESRATPRNSEVLALEAQIGALQTVIRDYRAEGGGNESIEVAPDRMPTLQMEIAWRQRAFDRDEELFESLSRGLEAAKLDVGVQKPLVQVVDWATVPDRKSWPPRIALVLLTALLGGLGAYGWVLLGTVMGPESGRWIGFHPTMTSGSARSDPSAGPDPRGPHG